MNKTMLAALCGMVAGAPAVAAELNMTLQIPRLTVAEYHRPYIAVWLESPDRKVLRNLAVWYDLQMQDHEGAQWLKDLRQWWRRLGRNLQMPVDGVSGATRPPGEHALGFSSADPALKDLPPGEYRLIVEATREVGGRELLQVTLQWPLRQPQQLSAQGAHELGALTVKLQP
jgi:hypothetical protein